MVVGEQDGIQMPNVVRQHLRTEIGTCIYQDLQSVMLHQRRRPEPLVPRVSALANGTLAGDDRHPL